MFAAIVAIGYAVGSIPFAFIIARHAGGVDIRRVGSGNVGTANVLRSAGARAALLTAAFDVGKGAAAVGIARALGGTPGACAAAGVAAIAGHVYPVWLRGLGGKGVATACGACAVLTPVATAAAVVVFGVAVGITRYVSVGSMAAALCLGPCAYLAGSPEAAVRAACAAGGLVLFRHRGNIVRLIAGSERRLGERTP